MTFLKMYKYNLFCYFINEVARYHSAKWSFFALARSFINKKNNFLFYFVSYLNTIHCDSSYD